MSRFLIFLLPLTLLLGLTLSLSLENVDICLAEDQPRVEIDPAFGSAADRFTLRVTLTNVQASAVTRPRFDSTEEFQIMPRGLFSREFDNNGVLTYEIVFQYVVTPAMTLAAGKYQLPNGVMLIRGQKVLLKGPEIEITNNQNQQRAPKSEQLSGIDFTHIVNSTNPYIGQQLLYRAEIVSERPLQYASLSPFEPNGYLRESLGEEARQERRIGTTTRLSMSEVLFPTKPGDLEIPKRDLELHVEVPMAPGRRGFGAGVPFDPSLDTDDPEEIIRRFLQNRNSPFLSRVAKVNLSAAAFPIHVRPLPKPQDSGLDSLPKGYIPVGDLEVEKEWSADSIHYGESVDFSLVLSGDANLRPYELPDFDFSQTGDFKVYSDKPELITIPTRNGIQFKKTFKVSFVPQRAGKLELPSLDLVWFDPSRERYQVYHIEKKQLIVLPDPKLELKKQLGKKESPSAIDSSPPPVPRKEKPEPDIAPQKRVPRVVFDSFQEKILGFCAGLLICPALFLAQCLKRRRDNHALSTRGTIARIQEELTMAQTTSDAYRCFINLIRAGFRVQERSLTGTEAQRLLRDRLPRQELADKSCELLSKLQKDNYGKARDQNPDVIEEAKVLGKQLSRFFSIVMFAFVFNVQPSSASDFRDALSRAQSLSEQEHWEDARRAYEQALRESPENPSIFYNIGNMFYHTGSFPRAIHAYLSALKYSPRDTQIKYNLRQTIRRLPDSVQPSIQKLVVFFEARFPFSTGELLLLFLSVWSVTWLLLLRSGESSFRLRRVTTFLSLALLILLSDALFQALQFESGLPRIVFTENARVYSTPGDFGQVIVLFQSGNITRELEKKGEWLRVSVEGGRSGWIRESDLGPKLGSW